MESWKSAVKEAMEPDYFDCYYGQCGALRNYVFTDGEWVFLGNDEDIKRFLREFKDGFAIRYSVYTNSSNIDIVYVSESKESRLSMTCDYHGNELTMDRCSTASKDAFNAICVLLDESDETLLYPRVASSLFEIMETC